MMKFALAISILTVVIFAAPQADADEVKIVAASAERDSRSVDNSFLFSVTLRHKDEGWQHYADHWEIWTPDGTSRLGTRKLLHPHVNEQPFTRSLSGVSVPEGTTKVLVRAHDTQHGISPHTFQVSLPEAK